MNEIEDKILSFFADYIMKHCGITYTQFNAYALQNRLNELVKVLGLNSIDELHQNFQGTVNKQNHDLLIDIATNNETSFFRDTSPFKILFEEIMPQVMEKNKASRTVTIWSAASSTGQEPYSILMGLLDKIPALQNWNLKIDATDLSERVLKRAKAGVYNQLEVQRGLPIRYLQKYFTKLDSGDWQIQPDLTKMIKYSQMNLLTSAFQANYYDIIFCRNVLIYQERNNKINIVRKLYGSLKKEGFLFLGSGESIYSINEQFKGLNKASCPLYQKIQ